MQQISHLGLIKKIQEYIITFHATTFLMKFQQ